MRYVLDRSKQSDFLNCILNNQKAENIEIDELIEGCKYFYFNVHANTYFLSKDIQSRIGKEVVKDDYINSIYKLVESSNFFLEEISHDFVDYMLQAYSNADQDIDFDLFEIYEKYLARYER